MNPQARDTHSKVYWRKDMLEFSKADFVILQTQSRSEPNSKPRT